MGVHTISDTIKMAVAIHNADTNKQRGFIKLFKLRNFWVSQYLLVYTYLRKIVLEVIDYV